MRWRVAGQLPEDTLPEIPLSAKPPASWQLPRQKKEREKRILLCVLIVHALILRSHDLTKATDCSNTKIQGLLGVWQLNAHVDSTGALVCFFECSALTHVANINFWHLIDRHTINNGIHSKSFQQGDGGGTVWQWCTMQHSVCLWSRPVKKKIHFYTGAGMSTRLPVIFPRRYGYLFC
jgi:hypothetical protein